MTDQTPFSATDSLTGYLFQVKYALLESIRKLRDDNDFGISIETLDDVTFDSSGNATDLLQVKHHSKPGNLTDASVDLWKTIRVWVNAFSNENVSRATNFYLVTTSRAAENSAAFYLKPSTSERNVNLAISALDSVARSSTNQENTAAYNQYLSLSWDQKASLFSRVNIIDLSPTITTIDSSLRKELLLAVEGKFLQPFLERLEAWWFRRALHHLISSDRQPILGEEILEEIGRLREQFKRDNLPVDDAILNALVNDAIYNDRIFVQQLRLIEINTKRILFAIRDYFRAYEHRSRWVRENLLEVDEIDRYERQLKEDWEIYFEQMSDLLGPDTAEAEKKRLAKELYSWVESGALRQIRSQISEPSLARGSYHILSDRQIVGWHPEFKQRLMQLLEV